MADPTGGLGLGLGGGAAVGAIAYVLDKMVGSGRQLKAFDTSLKELREHLEKNLLKEFGDLRKLSERATGLVEKLHDWHNVSDPDDPAGKIWYFSVGLRRALTDMQSGVGKLLDLLRELVSRLDRYNETIVKLITVLDVLQRDVERLQASVSELDRRGRD